MQGESSEPVWMDETYRLELMDQSKSYREQNESRGKANNYNRMRQKFTLDLIS